MWSLGRLLAVEVGQNSLADMVGTMRWRGSLFMNSSPKNKITLRAKLRPPESIVRSSASVLTIEHLKISARRMTRKGVFRGIPQNGWEVARSARGSGFALTVAA